MLHNRIMIPSAGAEIPLDLYIPHVSEEIDPDVRRPAVVICPGGAYYFRSEREAEPIALRFLTEGFNAFVVQYRVEPNRFPVPQQDAAAAVAWVRAHAQEYHTDPDQIAILGFSAGGHLAGSLSTLWHRADLWKPMNLAPRDVQPNAAVLCYPVISAGEYAHRGSFENLTGSADLSVHADYSVDGWVTENCPPVFLWHTFEDAAVPVMNSLLMAQALAKAGVKTEMHIYPNGAHGSSLCNETTTGIKSPHFRGLDENRDWPEKAARFLRQIFDVRF